MTGSQNPDLQRPANLTMSGPTGPVPEENKIGHHPEHEQDKPDLDDFAERFRHAPVADDPTTANSGAGGRVWVILGATALGALAIAAVIVLRRRRRSTHWWSKLTD